MYFNRKMGNNRRAAFPGLVCAVREFNHQPSPGTRKKTDYPTLDFAPSFRVFTAQRADLLALLTALAAADWARYALVQAYGQVHQRSVLHQADTFARHEREHTRQIERIAVIFI